MGMEPQPPAAGVLAHEAVRGCECAAGDASNDFCEAVLARRNGVDARLSVLGRRRAMSTGSAKDWRPGTGTMVVGPSVTDTLRLMLARLLRLAAVACAIAI